MKQPPLRRRDMGIAGGMIVVSQLVSSFQTTQNLSKELSDLKTDVKILAAKVDTLAEQLKLVKVAFR